MSCNNILTWLLLYNSLSGIVRIIQLYIGHSTFETIPSRWTLLPGVESQNVGCPCRFCGDDTYCQKMSHTIVPVGLPTSGVTTMYMYENNITALYANEFQGMKQLNNLVLYQNKISAVDRYAFVGLDNLRRLHLEHNRIRFLAEGTLTHMSQLNRLYLNDNELKLFPDDIHYLDQLQELNVAQNFIKRIHWSSFIPLEDLTSLTIWDNPLNCGCNTRELMKWLMTTGSKRGLETTNSIPTECAQRKDQSVQCKKPHISSIKSTRDDGSATQIFTLNSVAVLHCDISEDLIATWKVPQENFMFPYKRGRMQAFVNGTLRISNLVATDNGTYKCFAHYSNSRVSTTKAISILVVKGRKPEVKPSQKRIQTYEADQTRLECVVNSIPPARVTWQAPGHLTALSQSNFSSSGRFTLNDEHSTLTIKEVKKSDEGYWTCMATNTQGTAKGRINLQVEERVPADSKVTIIGAVVGGVLAATIAVVIAIFCAIKRRKNIQSNQSDQIGPKIEAERNGEVQTEAEIPATSAESEEKSGLDAENVQTLQETTAGKNVAKQKDKQKEQNKKDKKTKNLENIKKPDLDAKEQFSLTFLPGSDQLQQPFESEPAIKGFRL